MFNFWVIGLMQKNLSKKLIDRNVDRKKMKKAP